MSSLVDKINELKEPVDEARNQNTKIRQLEGMGSRKARLTVKEAKRMVERMMDPKVKGPSPKTEDDKRKLMESCRMMDSVMEKLYEVKDSRKKKQYENLSMSQSDAAKYLKKLEKPFEVFEKVLRAMSRDKAMHDEFSQEMEVLDNALEEFSSEVLARLEMAKNGE